MTQNYQVKLYSYETYSAKFGNLPLFDKNIPIQIFSHKTEKKGINYNHIHMIDSSDPLVNFYLIEMSKSLFKSYSKEKKISSACLKKAIMGSLEKCLNSQDSGVNLLKISRIQVSLQRQFPLLYIEEVFEESMAKLKINSIQTFSSSSTKINSGEKTKFGYGESTPYPKLNPNYREKLNS